MSNRWAFPRRSVFGTLICAAINGPLRAADSRELAPRFAAKIMDGEKVNNETLKGKVVLIEFWTTWCPYCKQDQPGLDTIAEEYGAKGLVVLAVNVGESRKKVRQYLEQSPRSCKIVLNEDTNLAAIYVAKAYPLYVLIDREGRVAGQLRGAVGEDRLRAFIAKAGLEE